LTFAVAGDSSGDDDVYKRLLEKVVQDGNAFLIHTGDMVSYGSQKQFTAFQVFMADFPLPFYPVPGNHDRDDDGTLANYLAYSGAPAIHYSFDVETAHFVMANSATGRLSEEELAWIDRDLAETDQPVKIVVTHYPPFDPDGTAHILRSGNETFMALMQEHDVAYVFLGHIHAYSEEERDGAVYVITGGAGASLYDQDHPDAFYHYVQVRVEGTRISADVVRVE
jgi:3',5'-cyclic AMP phosphodiesterase CpdA